MKIVEVNIEGNSLLAYVTFYDEDILSKLNEIDEGEYDFIDFSSTHEKSSTFLGRGFCENGNLYLKVSVDGTKVFDRGLITLDETGCPAEDIQQLKEIYGEDEDYKNCLIAKSSDWLEADDHFFADADKYKYCSLETVQCYKSPYTIQIEAEDDFKLSDLSLVLVDVDSGYSHSITQNLYSATNLEKQVFGIKYKGEFFEFYGGEDQGGTNYVYWFEREDIDEQQGRIKAANAEIDTLAEEKKIALEAEYRELEAEYRELEAAGEEVEEDEKSASETMREYVEKVSATMGDNKTWIHSEAIHERINEIDTW
jgi:hypothetical protein